MKARVEKITPAIAKKYLRNNVNIRKPNRDKIALMAADIAAGDWEENGESIKFRRGDGALVDGQNRLEAIVKADRAVRTVVVSDVMGSRYIDIGERRTLKQLLASEGVAYSNTIAAAVGSVLLYERASKDLRGKVSASHRERIAVFKKWKQPLQKWAHETTWYMPASRGGLCWLSQFTAICVLGSAPRGYASAKDDFLYYCATGEELKSDDPCYLLREILHESRRSRRTYPARHRLALTIKAWNAHRDGIALKQLVFKDTTPTAEPFPRIK